MRSSVAARCWGAARRVSATSIIEQVLASNSWSAPGIFGLDHLAAASAMGAPTGFFLAAAGLRLACFLTVGAPTKSGTLSARFDWRLRGGAYAMIPLKADNPTRTFPLINWASILVNVTVNY